MKSIVTKINEGMRGLNRRYFRHLSIPVKEKELSINTVWRGIETHISNDDDLLKEYNKLFKQLKSVYKTLKKLEEDDDLGFKLFRKIRNKSEVNSAEPEDIEKFIKDHDEELSDIKDLQEIQP